MSFLKGNEDIHEEVLERIDFKILRLLLAIVIGTLKKRNGYFLLPS